MLAEDLLGAGDQLVELAIVSAPNSTSNAAEVGGSSIHSCGAPAMFWAATISAGATISSTAVAPDSTRAGTGSVADSMPSK